MKPGLTIDRRFCPENDPLAAFTWQRRDARIGSTDGRVIFEQQDVEFPSGWSQTACDIVASKYFRGEETSLKDMIGRVVRTLREAGDASGYFAQSKDGDAFAADLTWLLCAQRLSFNSPVWFNVGIHDRPQASACFILSVDDSMEAILNWYGHEGRIFRMGSGAGANLSKLRAQGEPLSGGGIASGPLSFMRAADASAGAIKSGGTTRRSAKMVVLDADHPDVGAFVRCKADAEDKIRALVDAGYDPHFESDTYASVGYQNANNSVRVSDAFMLAATTGETWHTRWRTDDRARQDLDAPRLLEDIAQAAWRCGDPGLQFDDTINRWHTCPTAGRQEATNPCAEYCWINDSACNLASLNLLAFLTDTGDVDTKALRGAVRTAILAQDLLVGLAGYPTEAITRNSLRYRTLGLGYANLGALLMALALPYDSDEGRALAAGLTALMTAEAYLTSTYLARALGPFEGYANDRDAMLRVVRNHARHARNLLDESELPENLQEALRKTWRECLEAGKAYGFRNAQVTLLAPTGTIAFMMDCDTTGIEPDLALVKRKQLAGGGDLRLQNRTIGRALGKLGYGPHEQQAITRHIDETGSADGAPGLLPEHLPVFDCALPAGDSLRSLSPQAHLDMVAAVQPFLSGSVSKTINLPNNATVDDVRRLYVDAWTKGLKCVSVYRDGCRQAQPLAAAGSRSQAPKPHRRHLPDERPALTHKFQVAGHEGYLTVGLYPENNTPGEIFIVMAKEGSTVSGLTDAFATSISLALQYGVPLSTLVDKFAHMRFEPAGFTGNPDIPMAKSVMDYVFRWLARRFLPDAAPDDPAPPEESRNMPAAQADAPACMDCGSLMVRTGACYGCPQCGATGGCS